MSKNRSKANPVQPGPQSFSDRPDSPESPKWLEMTENAGENKIFGPQSSSDRPDSRESPEWLEMTENAKEKSHHE